jgi:hypothetical protein
MKLSGGSSKWPSLPDFMGEHGDFNCHLLTKLISIPVAVLSLSPYLVYFLLFLALINVMRSDLF